MPNVTLRIVVGLIFLTGASSVLRDWAIGLMDWTPLFLHSEFLVYFSGAPFAFLLRVGPVSAASPEIVVAAWVGVAMFMTVVAAIFSDVVLRKLNTREAVKFTLGLIVLSALNFFLSYFTGWLQLFATFDDTNTPTAGLFSAGIPLALQVLQCVLTLWFFYFFYRKTTFKAEAPKKS